MGIQVMPLESGLCLSSPMNALVVSIGDEKHKPDSKGITCIRMLPDNLYK